MMAKTESRKSIGTNVIRGDHSSRPETGRREIPAAELLSFLKEVRGVQAWTEKDLAKILRIGLPQAKEAIAVLQLQSYIQPAGNTAKWRVTEQGEIVSGAKPPRFTRQSVDNALAGVRDRIKAA